MRSLAYSASFGTGKNFEFPSLIGYAGPVPLVGLRVSGRSRKNDSAVTQSRGNPYRPSLSPALPYPISFRHLDHKLTDFPNALTASGRLVSLPLFSQSSADRTEYASEHPSDACQRAAQPRVDDSGESTISASSVSGSESA